MIDLSQKPFFLTPEDVAWVEKTKAGMSVKEKIHQLFCLIAYSSDEDYLHYLTDVLHIGGIMCRTMDLEEVEKTVNTIQTSAKIPFLIAANLEAGANGVCLQAAKYGSEMQVAANPDHKKAASRLGEICGKEGKALGVNWSFAPIVDIDFNFRNPITNTRTFGSNPQTVEDCGLAYIRACQKQGLAACAKHFPGDGVDERDQHLVPTINALSTEEWDATYGKIYKAMIDEGVKTIMVGHILQPAYERAFDPSIADRDILPASLSPNLVSKLLRGKLGFQGLTITDSTTMAGLNMMMDRATLVPMTIACGNDMFLFTRNLEEDIRFMEEGYEKGIITPERLDEAVTRILALKASLHLHEKPWLLNQEEAKQAMEDPEHLAWVKEASDGCITLVKEEKGVLPLSSKKYPRVLVYSIESKTGNMGFSIKAGAAAFLEKELQKRGYEVSEFHPKPGFEGMMESSSSYKDNYDLILYVVNMATRSNQTVVRIEWDEPMGANVPTHMNDVPTVMVSVENPYHLLDAPRVRTYINTYGSQDEVLLGVLDKLEGKSSFVGVSPSDPFCGKWDTHL